MNILYAFLSLKYILPGYAKDTSIAAKISNIPRLLLPYYPFVQTSLRYRNALWTHAWQTHSMVFSVQFELLHLHMRVAIFAMRTLILANNYILVILLTPRYVYSLTTYISHCQCCNNTMIQNNHLFDAVFHSIFVRDVGEV